MFGDNAVFPPTIPSKCNTLSDQRRIKCWASSTQVLIRSALFRRIKELTNILAALAPAVAALVANII